MACVGSETAKTQTISGFISLIKTYLQLEICGYFSLNFSPTQALKHLK